jgi:shikimate dehydrogenase
MHNAAFAALGMDDWAYGLLPVPPELFAETARALPGSGYRGANVTIPHKVAALAIADTTTAAARGSGAANTLTYEDDGAIAADNTDVGGFIDALGADPHGMRALILGAGGSARGVAWALREAGAAEVAIWNRTAERAADLVRDLELASVSDPRPADYDLLVNTTSIGLRDGDSITALPLGGAPSAVVVDLVYRNGSATPVIAWGEGGGARTVDGLEMLVRQGARSFERWTGVHPPLDVMRAAARG